MGREVRRVPAGWEHPRGRDGNYEPTHERFPYCPEEIEEGLRDGWLVDTPPNYGVPVMPDWPDGERTHYQLYENVSEGTPCSPPMESEEALARWLFENPEEAHLVPAGENLSYERWLSFVKQGSAPSFAFGAGGTMSGVAAMTEGER